jgi:hypothetical protein
MGRIADEAQSDLHGSKIDPRREPERLDELKKAGEAGDQSRRDRRRLTASPGRHKRLHGVRNLSP